MPILNYHFKCRVCGNPNLLSIMNLGNHYLHGSFNFKDFKPSERRVPVELMRCPNELGGCGLIQLKHSIDPDILYARYGYRSATNETMRQHLSNIVKNAIKIHKSLVKDLICLDIGCNDGYLLKQYPENFKKVGIDPCDIGNSIKDIKNFTFINDIFPTDKYTEAADIVTMIACFYDTNEPFQLATRLESILKPKGIAVVEVSYWPEKMKQNAIDEVCQEHVAFYNYQNLEGIFKRVGLTIFDAKLNNINGGSIQLWLCRNDIYATAETKKNILNIKMEEFTQRLDTNLPYFEFANRCGEMKTELLDLIQTIKQDKKTIHLYGASTKGNVLLQYLGLDSSIILYAAERSPEKVGGSTLGTNIKMISEEVSRAMKPNFYFVPIWSFKKEIIQREKKYLEEGGKLIFPLPKLEIVSK